MDILFDKPLWGGAKGRDGWMHTQGPSITPTTWQDTPAVMLEPVSCRGTCGSCVVIVPITTVPALIGQLQAALATA